jgi:adenylate cyclase
VSETNSPSPAAALAELTVRLARCPDLDVLVGCALDALAEQFGFEHSLLLLLDGSGQRLTTLASHGYDAQGVGSEVAVGEGLIGMVAARNEPMRLGNLRQMVAYARAVRREYELQGEHPGREIPLPGLPDAQSLVAVPATVHGQVLGVLAIESPRRLAFDADDEAVLTVVGALLAAAIEIDWAYDRAAEGGVAGAASPRAGLAAPAAPVTRVRFFPVDGSCFLDGDYLIKGVAGRVLWLLLRHHVDEGRVEFTNKEVRLDPSLELPELRDNLESRLCLLKRRLDERDAPVRIEKTGRGRFRLSVAGPLRLEHVEG